MLDVICNWFSFIRTHNVHRYIMLVHTCVVDICVFRIWCGDDEHDGYGIEDHLIETYVPSSVEWGADQNHFKLLEDLLNENGIHAVSFVWCFTKCDRSTTRKRTRTNNEWMNFSTWCHLFGDGKKSILGFIVVATSERGSTYHCWILLLSCA